MKKLLGGWQSDNIYINIHIHAKAGLSLKYLIDSTLVYSDEDKTIHLVGAEHEAMVLSNQASRLLDFFVRSPQETHVRDFLLEKVWEDAGFTASNNNLSVAVSELRKKISSCGITKDFISTIPKIGFSFNASVHVIDADDNQRGKQNKRLELFFLLKPVTIVMFSVILFAAVKMTYDSLIYTGVINKTDGFLLFKTNGCSVFELDNESNGDMSGFIKAAKDDIEASNIDCTNKGKRHNVYHKRVFKNNSASAYNYIAICNDAPIGDVNNCRTIIK